MTETDPTVLLLLDSPAERTAYRSLLQADAAWHATILERNLQDFLAVQASPSEKAFDLLGSANIVIFNESLYRSYWPQIQDFWGGSNTAFLILLDHLDEVFVAGVLTSGVHDYLDSSQLSSIRLRQTIKNLWQQTQLRQALAVCEQQDVFDRAAVGINQADPSGRFIRVNQQFCELLGYSEAELLQLTYQGITHPDDLRHQLEREKQLFDGTTDKVTLEKRYLKKDGCPLWTRVTLSVIKDNFERPVCDLAIVEDISERKQAEADLNIPKKLLRAFLDNLPHIAWLKDREGRFIAVNAAFGASCGISPRELVGKTDLDIWPPELANTYREDDLAVITSGQQKRREEHLVASDGSRLWIDTIKAPVFEDTGEILGTVGIAIDITHRKQAEQNLLQANRNMEAIFAAFPDLLFHLSADGTIYEYRARSNDDLYAGPQQFLGQKVQDILPPEAGQLILAKVQQALVSGVVETVEYSLPIGHQEKVFDARIVALDDTNVMAVVRDISDRKAAEAALQVSEERLRTALEAANMGSWNWSLDTNEVVWSESLERLMGLEPGNFDGQIETVTAMIHPDDRQRVADSISRSLEQGTQYDIEFRFVKPDGSIRWAASQGAAVVRDSDGRVIGMAGMDIDITERKQIEIALRESESRFQQLANTVKEGFFVFEVTSDRYSYINPAYQALTGLSVEDGYINSKHWLAGVHPDDRERMEGLIQRELQGETTDAEYRFIRPDGEICWLRSQAFPLFDASGQVSRIVGTVEDISDRKRAALQIASQNTLLAQIAQGMPLPEILNTLVQEVEHQFEDIMCSVLLLDAENRLQHGANQKLSADYVRLVEEVKIGDGVGSCGTAAFRNQTVISADIAQDAKWQDFRETALSFGLRACWSTPIMGRNGQVLGTFGIYCGQARSPRPTELEILEQMANIAGIAIERSRAKADLKASEAQYRRIVETANEGIWIIDATDITSFVNPNMAALLGYDVADMVGQLPYEFMDPADIESARVWLQQFRQGNTQQFDFRLRHRDGTDVWVMVSTSPIWDEAGQYAGTLGMVTNISDRKQAELALQQLNEELEQRVQQRTEALARSEEDLRTVFNNVYDAIFLHDLDGIILDVNARAMEISGATREQLIGASIVDLSDSTAPLEAAPERLQRAQAGETLWFEWRNRRFDDNTGFDTEVTVRQIHLNNRPILLAGVRDISDRKRAARQLDAERLRLQVALEAAQMGTWESDMETGFWSERTEAIFGYAPGRFPGDREAFLKLVHADDQERVFTSLATSFAHQIPYVEEYRIHRLDGEIRWVAVNGKVIASEDGSGLRMIGVTQDITERKLLEQQQARLLSILEAAPDHIGMATPDGNVIWNNRQAKLLRGLPFDTDVTQLSMGTYHPQWAIDMIQQEGIPTAIQSGIWIGETALLTFNDKEIPVSQLILAHRSATGEVEYLSTIIRDISPLKEAEQALRKANADLETRVIERTAELVDAKEAAEAANRAKSIFLANMSHELRTPLNAILGFSQLMGRDRTLSSKHLEELQIINSSGEHLLTLINDILEMSKIEAGQVILNPINFELSRILNSLSDMLRFKAEAKGLTFSLQCHPQLPRYIRTDSHKLRQVLLNLLSNAVKFTQTGYVVLRVAPGNPRLSAADKADAVADDAMPQLTLRFEVEDSGAGIAADERDLLFEPFAQTASGRQSQEGTGLGLPISRQFVNLLGGNLEVISEPDVGSTFTFEIPVQVIEATAVETAGAPPQAIAIAPGQPIYRILVVEDNWANRVLLQNLLTELGFEVQTAVNGQTAIECWQIWRPHLIFMDIRMPEMNGYDATQEIRRLESLAQGKTADAPCTKIISLTAGVFESNQLEFGFDDVVCKPIQEATITQIIAHHLGVRYIYDDISTPYPELPSPATSVPLTTEIFQALSTDWIRQFHAALIQLKQDDMLALIASLPPENAVVAQPLTQKVQDFDYEFLLDLIQTSIST